MAPRPSPPTGGKREGGRQEIPVELRRDIRMLGDLLGQVVSEYGGGTMLRDVEQLRLTVIRAREDATYERQAEELVASWWLSRATVVARAFTCYFHLANLAEEHHRARVLRERDRDAKPSSESLDATIAELRRQVGARRLRELLAEL